MRLVRRPGESAEVDWAGQKAHWFDPDTGERMEAPVFVGVLSSSRYAYVEAFSAQDQESWLNAHVNMLRFFGGVPRILVPDNLKTGVTKADRYDPVINRVYRELAEHYGTAVIPARIRKPRDKANAEGTVGIVTTWILAALRDRVFFSISELNEGIAEKFERFNAKPFQKKEGSRLDAFLAEEKAALLPLPGIPYELSSWKKAIADKSYHISIEKMLYSAPYEYIGHEMEIRLTRNVVEIFFDGQRVCSHTRLRGRPGQCSTVPSHTCRRSTGSTVSGTAAASSRGPRTWGPTQRSSCGESSPPTQSSSKATEAATVSSGSGIPAPSKDWKQPVKRRCSKPPGRGTGTTRLS